MDRDANSLVLESMAVRPLLRVPRVALTKLIAQHSAGMPQTTPC
jgi:hypothetical protein